MTRFLRATTSAAALALVAGAAFADSIADQVVSQLQAQGFTRFEVDQGPSQVKIEAIRGSQAVEYVYDLATGQLLSREIGAVGSDDDTTPGVEFDESDEDFVDGPDGEDGGDGDEPGDDDEGGDDHGGGHGDDDDDGEDDDRGHGNDDDGFDDDNPGQGHGDDGEPGGGHHDGDDDEGGDDEGGDDHEGGHHEGGGDDDDEGEGGRGRGGDRDRG